MKSILITLLILVSVIQQLQLHNQEVIQKQIVEDLIEIKKTVADYTTDSLIK